MELIWYALRGQWISFPLYINISFAKYGGGKNANYSVVEISSCLERLYLRDIEIRDIDIILKLLVNIFAKSLRELSFIQCKVAM